MKTFFELWLVAFYIAKYWIMRPVVLVLTALTGFAVGIGIVPKWPGLVPTGMLGAGIAIITLFVVGTVLARTLMWSSPPGGPRSLR